MAFYPVPRACMRWVWDGCECTTVEVVNLIRRMLLRATGAISDIDEGLPRLRRTCWRGSRSFRQRIITGVGIDRR